MMNKQSGYTLIEFMVAGVLGLILLLGVMQIYLGASQTNRLQAGVIEVQDMGRFALTYLEKDLQRAGWSNLDPGVNLGTLDAHINFGSSSNGASDGNDAMSVTYQADWGTGVDVNYDCGGATVTHGNEITNRYAVVDGSLECNGKELLTNVESFQILYGVENFNTLGDGIVDGYLTATQIGGYEELVIAVRLAILLRSSNDILEQNNTNSYTVLDTTFAAQNDRKLRRLFVKTILLPNRPQAF